MQRLADRGGRDRPQQIDLCVLLRAGREWVEPHTATGGQRDRPHADRVTERAVLTLDIEHERSAPEQQHPPEQRLDQRALALPELADHDRVGVVQRTLLVEHPGVEAEGSAAGVAADERAPAPESAARGERVDRLGVSCGHAVSRTCGAHRRPRASGSVNLNASACWPYMRCSSSRARAAWPWTSAHARRSSPSSRPLTVTNPARRTSP